MKWPWSKPPRTRLSSIDVLKKYKGYSWDSFCKYATMEDLDDFITGGGLELVQGYWMEERAKMDNT